LGMIAAGGRDGQSVAVPISYPPGTSTIQLRAIGKCDSCKPTHEQILTIHITQGAGNTSSLEMTFRFPAHPNRSLLIDKVSHLVIHLKSVSGTSLDLPYSKASAGSWYEFHELPVGSHTPPVNILATPLPSKTPPGNYYVTEITGAATDGQAIRVCAESPEITLPEGKDSAPHIHKAENACSDYIAVSSITKN